MTFTSANMDGLRNKRERLFSFNAFTFDKKRGLKNFCKASILFWVYTWFPSASHDFHILISNVLQIFEWLNTLGKLGPVLWAKIKRRLNCFQRGKKTSGKKIHVWIKKKNTITITKSQVNFKKKLTVSCLVVFMVVFSRFLRTASLYFLLYVHTQYTQYALVWFCSMYSLWLVVSEMMLEIFWEIISSRICFLKHLILHSCAEWLKTPYNCSGCFLYISTTIIVG